MKLVAWAATDNGRKRDHNEDNFLLADDLGLFAVADGMGGHQGGETASRIAVEVMRREVIRVAGDMGAAAARILRGQRAGGSRDTQPVRIVLDAPELDFVEGPTDPAFALPDAPAAAVMADAARSAGFAIFDAALDDPALRGMGTTLTAMLHHEGVMHVVHAGDSRAYLFRDRKLDQVTEDHSWIAEQVKAGAMTESEARESQFRHIITRSVGFERDVQVDRHSIELEPGDCFLLCSDGMSNYIDGDELERVLDTSFYRRCPRLLIDLANERGGDDNITVVIVYVANDAS